MELFTLIAISFFFTCLIYGYNKLKKKPAGQIVSSLESDLAEIENLLKVQESKNDPKENENMMKVLDEKVENSRKKVKKSKQEIEKLEEKLQKVDSENQKRARMHILSLEKRLKKVGV